MGGLLRRANGVAADGGLADARKPATACNCEHARAAEAELTKLRALSDANAKAWSAHLDEARADARDVRIIVNEVRAKLAKLKRY